MLWSSSALAYPSPRGRPVLAASPVTVWLQLALCYHGGHQTQREGSTASLGGRTGQSLSPGSLELS